ncbi:MAG: DUF4214 domain-containing protein [Actinomycetota bacterium]
MSTFRRCLSKRIALIPVVALVAIVLPPTAAQAASSGATFVGHGWGHGRGMGQYGAYGYAVNSGWTYDRILTHYYGGTTLATNAGNPTITVELTRVTGVDTIVTGNGLAINNVAVGDAAVLVRRTGSGAFQAYSASGCGGPWKVKAGLLGSGLMISTSGSQAVMGNLVRVCEPKKSTWYRGRIKVVDGGGKQFALNSVGVQDYLRGVVPRESPASWGSAGSGRGMEALKAQAVAARSYSLGSAPRSPSGASTCDTTACQVYGGAFEQFPGVTLKTLEDPNTDAAVATTSGRVMRAANRSIARTEFSSSTGGWTAGGTFPAVEDLGDATPNNPNHTWATSLSFSVIAAGLGTGTIRSMAVTARNGLGIDGGRATNVRVVSTAEVVRDFSGNQVRAALGLKSDWFSISGSTLPEAQSVVKALYQDLLLRNIDPTGLTYWSLLLAGGTGGPALVASLTRSSEYVQLRITQAYLRVLGRAPDAAGLAGWSSQILAGKVPVDDVQRRFYSSQEFANRSGGTDAGFVAALYPSILGATRVATSVEVDLWVAKVRQYGRSKVVDSIWFSFEAASARAGAYYLLFLKRAADPAGRATWARVLLAQGEGTVRTGIAGSQEYWNRAQTRAF